MASIASASAQLKPLAREMSALLAEVIERKIRPSDIAALCRIVQAPASSVLTAFARTATILENLAEENYLEPNDADRFHGELKRLLGTYVARTPALGPTNPGTVTEWYLTLVGSVARAFLDVAHVEYVRTKAGDFAARQTAERAKKRFDAAMHIFDWIDESRDASRVEVPGG